VPVCQFQTTLIEWRSWNRITSSSHSLVDRRFCCLHRPGSSSTRSHAAEASLLLKWLHRRCCCCWRWQWCCYWRKMRFASSTRHTDRRAGRQRPGRRLDGPSIADSKSFGIDQPQRKRSINFQLMLADRLVTSDRLRPICTSFILVE